MFKNSIRVRFVGLSTAALCMMSALTFTAPMKANDVIAADGELTAFEITEEMQIGWNLGNTLDATSALSNPGLSSETAWGNPVTTKEMIDAVKAKGFNTVRIPTTWYQHLDENNNIDPAWLARVKEIVDYCFADDMYVILNVHHEEWVNRADLGSAYDEMHTKLMAIWSQVAEEFKDYDQHLIFECMNEPRAAGTTHEWWGPEQSEVDTINKLNADFVELIRSIDSPYKDNRLLMIPDYCASSDSSIYSKLVIPDDDFIAVSIHAYSPYGFTMDATLADHSTYTTAYSNELHSILKGLRDTFIDKDIPVVLGEFSASNFDNTEARVEWANDYISTTKTYGIPCVLWDNNVKGNNEGEAHGYLNRSDLTWYEPSEPVVDEMMKVIADDSIPWGGEKKAPVIEHDDLSTGKNIFEGPAELDATVDNGNCTPGLNVTWADLDGKDVAVEFTGDAPVIALTNDEWENWTEVKPYDVDTEKGIAYYSCTDIAAAWGEDKVDAIAHLFSRTNSVTTVKNIYLINASGAIVDPPEDNTIIYTLDLADADRSGKLVLTFECAPGSTMNGCVGFMLDDWTAIEWEGKTDADGKLVVEIDMADIPESVKSAQAQVWWCDDKDNLEFSYEVVTEGTTTPSDEPAEVNYGDVNCDDSVDLADAVLIMQFSANPDEYGSGKPNGISEQGMINADVYGNDGITNRDALSIQKFKLGLITSLPELEVVPVAQ